jgi:hypothetical protein
MKNAVFLAMALLFLLSPSILKGEEGSSTVEDSLNSRLSSTNATVIGGYGDAVYQNNSNTKMSSIDLERVVLFVGHNFETISFFSELEMENAKVSGGESGGEIAFEQAYLKFNLDQNHYITAGLFLPRIGILNETHLPTEFNGNERTQVETNIIPSTWRELGVGFYGNVNLLPLNYSIAIVNGLNSETFEHGSGIREGRYEGRNATANNLAVTGALQLYSGNVKMEASGYYGGTVGLASWEADSLKLTSGMFGTPVIIGEGDAQYDANGFSVRILGTIVSIPDAMEINRAFANNTPQSEYGTYAEVAYDIFHTMKELHGKQLIAFVRYEKLDINATVPSNGVIDGTLKQQYIVVGLNYLPINDVVVKTDVSFVGTGDQNPALVIAPVAYAQPYKTNNTIFTLGIGFSF